MPTQTEIFRTNSRTELRRTFTSLGIERAAFAAEQFGVGARPFDAIANADRTMPDCVWLFRGRDVYTYDLTIDAIVSGPTPYRPMFGGDKLPAEFSTRIDGLTWLGPSFPNLWTMFRENWYYTLDAAAGSSGHEGPRGVLAHMASGVWCNGDGTWRRPGVPVALYGVGAQYDGMLHLFKDGEYVRHNCRVGLPPALGPVPVTQVWNLPEPFASHIDYAFYGAREHVENINLISGDDYLLFDPGTGQVLDRRPFISRFPGFAQFLRRPQLFLGEDYTLEVLVGPISLGKLIDTRTVGAGTTIKRVMRTETTTKSTATITQSMLESQDATTSNDFYQKVDKGAAHSGSSESYRYQLNADFHGDASATGLSGEVNAQLAAHGQTETVRESNSDAILASIDSQLAQTQQATTRKTFDAETKAENETNVLREETFEEVNSTDQARVYDFYEQLQSYLTLITLQRAVVLYSDGVSLPRVAELQDVKSLLAEVLRDPAVAEQVQTFLCTELSSITDATGEVRSLLEPSGVLKVARGLHSTYDIGDGGATPPVTVEGIIVAAKRYTEPTLTITPVQRGATA